MDMFSTNNRFLGANPDRRSAAWFLFKEFLKTAGWLVVQSCYSFGGENDSCVISRTSDIIDNEDKMAANYVWFVIRCPDGIRELLVYKKNITTDLLVAGDDKYPERLNAEFIIAYSKKAKFLTTPNDGWVEWWDNSTYGSYKQPVDHTSPPIAYDAIWLHKADNWYGNTSSKLKTIIDNGVPKTIRYTTTPSLRYPGVPNCIFSNSTGDSTVRKNYWGSEISQSDTWCAHFYASTTAPYNIYMLWTKNNTFTSLFAIDFLKSTKTTTDDNALFINMPHNPILVNGPSKHNVYMKSWYGDMIININNRDDFAYYIGQNRYRFLETAITYFMFYINSAWNTCTPSNTNTNIYNNTDLFFPMIYCRNEDQRLEDSSSTLSLMAEYKGISSLFSINGVYRKDLTMYSLNDRNKFICINWKNKSNFPKKDPGTAVVLPWDESLVNYQ